MMYPVSTTSRPLGRHALVVGAGMGGLAAAGALARHFERVTVLERDALADGPAHRPGTPQSRQLHGLLFGGLEALCRVFPGFDRDLAAAGAAPIRVAGDVYEEVPGFDPFPRRDFGATVYAASRPLLEHTLRQRVSALPNVMIRDQCRVLDLVPSEDQRSIVGARRAGSGGIQETVPADLVVDASARGGLTQAALEAMGRTRPRETTVGVGIGYATMTFALPERRPDWKAVLTFPLAPVDSRCGYLIPIEQDRWLATITELHCPQPPADLGGFLEAARGLRTRTIHDAIRNATPVGVPQRFALAESSWRHYEAVPDFPEGLISVGDAFCRFNPVYGQGMSVAAREAWILASLLARRAADGEGLKGLASDYFAEAGLWIAGAWSMSATPDLAYPQTRGERPADLEQKLGFVEALHRLAARDPDVHKVLVLVRYLARPSSALNERTLRERVLAEMQGVGPQAEVELARVAA
jgi:2-polyprenyl-6-methoxyphenol hydroxylase-like FAD-dependent oxidoreductase